MSQSGLLPSVNTPSEPGADIGSGFDWRRLVTPACFAVAGVLLYFMVWHHNLLSDYPPAVKPHRPSAR